MRPGRAEREGMALLTVLLLTAAMAAVAVVILDDVRFSVRRAVNAESGAQAQALAAGAERLAAARIAALRDPAARPAPEAWRGQTLTLPIEGGAVAATLDDGQACFNLNSVVQGVGEDLSVRELGLAQFLALGRALGVETGSMAAAGDALVDWLDADTQARPLGAEDAAYGGAYRTGGVMLAEVSELRAIKGFAPDVYDRLRPWVCALPTTALSPINPDSLTPDEAPLLTMLTLGGLPAPAARQMLTARPAGGWGQTDVFWSQPALATLPTSDETRAQPAFDPRWFRLRIEVEQGGARAVRTTLLHAAPDGAVRTVIRRWTLEE